MGVIAGAVLGAQAELSLVAAPASPFIASPLFTPLTIPDWGASLGGFVRAAAGAGNKGGVEALVRAAISTGRVVLVAETATAQQTAITQEVMQDSANNYRDLSFARDAFRLSGQTTNVLQGRADPGGL